jgi:amino acid permease
MTGGQRLKYESLALILGVVIYTCIVVSWAAAAYAMVALADADWLLMTSLFTFLLIPLALGSWLGWRAVQHRRTQSAP